MNTYNIGAKIRKLRHAKNLTLQTVAQETGFSPALISQIENNNVSPPIATLSKIACFFDVKIGVFFEEEETRQRFEVVRANERKTVLRATSQAGIAQGYSYASLSFQKKHKKMEPFLVSSTIRLMDEGGHSHDGEEFIYVLKGNALLLIDERMVTLSEGDSIYFDSTLTHRLFSRDDNEVSVLAVVTR